MKKLTLLLFATLISFSMQAQRCAVLEFKAGVGISQADVDGISGMFITYFNPSGYTMVERTQIDKAIDEQGLQRSEMTESQMVRIGQILNVSKIVVGDVNIVMGQYNVDVRIINVESGTVAATGGDTFAGGTSYRATMQKIAQNLASQIAITPSAASFVSKGTASGTSRSSVETLYGYLKIFPNELGIFQDEPVNVIKQINAQAQHGYNNWRIPNNEELSLMRANNYLGNGEYMTRESKHGIVLLVTDGDDYESVQAKEKERIALEQARLDAERARQKLEAQRRLQEVQRQIAQKNQRRKELLAQGWVDLGLPSGTIWKSYNESDGEWAHFTYEDACKEYAGMIPSDIQWRELKEKCKWVVYNSNQFQDITYMRVIGPNGNELRLPASGMMRVGQLTSTPYGENREGYYWSSSGRCFYFTKSISKLQDGYKNQGYLLRLAY